MIVHYDNERISVGDVYLVFLFFPGLVFVLFSLSTIFEWDFFLSFGMV